MSITLFISFESDARSTVVICDLKQMKKKLEQIENDKSEMLDFSLKIAVKAN